jgi:hypothetical protein
MLCGIAAVMQVCPDKALRLVNQKGAGSLKDKLAA